LRDNLGTTNRIDPPSAIRDAILSDTPKLIGFAASFPAKITAATLLFVACKGAVS
jgi:hypothetical protein